MEDKARSPLRAILGVYVLLRANELDDMDMWTGRLVTSCGWLPDALAVRVEFLARMAQHRAAFELLLDVANWGVPWFRSGVAYLEKRAKIYASVANRKASDLQASDREIKKISGIASVFSELAGALDMTHTTTVFRDISRIS